MTKKTCYTAPTVNILDVELEVMLAASKETDVNISDKETDDDAMMTHKKDSPWSFTWE